MADWDKDERYMATNDLLTLLTAPPPTNNTSTSSSSSKSKANSAMNKFAQTTLTLDAKSEVKICAAILKQLDDQNNDVQSIAVKCLGVLVKKVREEQIFR